MSLIKLKEHPTPTPFLTKKRKQNKTHNDKCINERKENYERNQYDQTEKLFILKT